MTPTRLAYESWLKTEKPIIYNTRDGKGNDIDVVVDLLPPESHKHYDSALNGICAMCGSGFTGGAPIGRVFSSTYTDWGIHKAPESEHMCAACLWATMMNVSSGRQALFRYTFVASAERGLEICNRAQMRDALLGPPKPPFVAIVAVSQKKHLITKAAMSFSKERYLCMLEEECIEVELSPLRRLVKIIEALRGLGCTKDEIATRNFRYERLKSWGMENLERATEILQPHCKSRMMPLALYVAQKNENEEECKCVLGFRQTMK